MENLGDIFLVKPEKATDIKHYSTDFEEMTVGIGVNYGDYSWFPVSSLLTVLGANALEKLSMTH